MGRSPHTRRVTPDSWEWDLRDDDDDGRKEVAFGMALKAEAEVVFRWSAAEKCYVGPKGSPQAQWMVLDPSDFGKQWEDAKRFAAAKRETKDR